MKYMLAGFIDLDSFIFIIITIVILVLSGIGSARKRKARQSSGVPETQDQDETGPGSPVPGMDTFSRLEEMFTGRMGFSEETGTGIPTDEADIVEEHQPQATSQDTPLPEEGIPTVEPLDDEEESSITIYDLPDAQLGEKRLKVSELFKNMDEIKKAVIYSEIFNRKYY